ncbi:MAG: hypothetical protein ACUVX9_15750 [Anaerolineae bacterium]
MIVGAGPGVGVLHKVSAVAARLAPSDRWIVDAPPADQPFANRCRLRYHSTLRQGAELFGREQKTALLKQLVHNGVVVPPPPMYSGLILTVRGRAMTLTPEQEEMALAWARKQGTPYVEDPVFVRNFLTDFAQALGVEPPLREGEVDFGPAIAAITWERAAREALTPEQRKVRAAENKAKREALREQYGRAIVDGEAADLATYLVEPSGIFMGRGQHPLRGRWKPGPQQRDITLNLSPDAPTPPGDWGGRVWEAESMWIARWKDKLSGKTKYIWLADTASIKQDKEARKFDRATQLNASIDVVRAHICAGLQDPDPRRRRVATAAYLIDKLCLRVGDEKDPDEADTVGATTLRPEHVTLHGDGTVEFRFLGKDSVEWYKPVDGLPEQVRQNLEELLRDARPSRNGPNSAAGDRPQLFPDVSSRDVNAFLAEALPGLTAKVFRTRHATAEVKKCLAGANITADAPEYQKRAVAMQANLAAAKLCNHYKKAPAKWQERQARMRERRDALQQRLNLAQEQLKAFREAEAALQEEARAQEEAASPKARARVAASWAKRLAKARQKTEAQRLRLARAQETLERFDSQTELASLCRTWNLGTSLKSYIDPRVYAEWGQQVAYDVLSCYYPKTLQAKFAWAWRREEEPDMELEQP